MRLSLATLAQVAPSVRRPAYDVAALRSGIVHLGLGAFHRAHQAFFTEDAIETGGGNWGIIGVSMRKPDIAASLTPQDGLYTVATLDRAPAYRVIGALRRALALPQNPGAVLAAIADPATRIVTLTVTEKGYCLAGDSLDLAHPDIVHDLAAGPPRSAVGVLAMGLARRYREGGAPLTVISCDNLTSNGLRLAAGVRAFITHTAPPLLRWLETSISFPETMVDCIVPASDAVSRGRVDAAIGMTDAASVQREPFAQWIIQDRFADARPSWGAGVEIVERVEDYHRLKLHVLNATHSALAYLGLRRRHIYVREAIADDDLARHLDAMIETEIAPALPELPVDHYWTTTRARFANPMIDHRLDQIAEDGGVKLAERLYPLMLANLSAGRPIARMAAVVRGWLEHVAPGIPVETSLQDTELLPPSFHAKPGMVIAVARAEL